MTPRIGLDAQWLLPDGGAGGALSEFADRARVAGLDHLSVGDHVSFRDGSGFDGLINAMALLASTPGIDVHVGVYLLPLRHPVLVARQLATIAERAPGRLVVACGVGGEDRNEFRICGVDPATRGKRADEALDVLRGLLTGHPLTHDGEFFAFEDAVIRPAPSQPIPLLIGGRADAAMERTARIGDGYQAIWISAERFGRAVTGIEERAEALGRIDPPTAHAMSIWCGFDHDGVTGRDRAAGVMEAFYGVPFSRFERYVPTGSPEVVAEGIRPYVAAGCRSVTIIAPGLSGEAAIDLATAVRAHLHR